MGIQNCIQTIYKGAFGVYKQSVNKISLNAEEYWIRELSGKDEATVKNYQRYFNDFLAYLNTTADKLLAQRIEHLKHDDIKDADLLSMMAK